MNIINWQTHRPSRILTTIAATVTGISLLTSCSFNTYTCPEGTRPSKDLSGCVTDTAGYQIPEGVSPPQQPSNSITESELTKAVKDNGGLFNEN